MTNATPATWGTYKANWELYDQYDKRPTPWDDYNAPYMPSLCPQAKPTDKQLLMVTKGDTELSDVNQAFSFPLVDQASNFVFFEVRYNKPYYDFVRGDDTKPATWLYFSKNLPTDYTQVPLPPNPTNSGDAIMIKAAWRNLAPLPPAQRSRYYTINAWVYNSATKQCSQQPMGLVGFHIAQKTSLFTEWIWSTFEQVRQRAAEGRRRAVVVQQRHGQSADRNAGIREPAAVPGFESRPAPAEPDADAGGAHQSDPDHAARRIDRRREQRVSRRAAEELRSGRTTSSSSRSGRRIPTQFKPPANRGMYPQDCGARLPGQWRGEHDAGDVLPERPRWPRARSATAACRATSTPAPACATSVGASPAGRTRIAPPPANSKMTLAAAAK